ncbi:LssY C-terminal domain-containing protein [Actinotignum urinale]|uniref:LssY C-terminal domain-containing protein n=1 Tax=Actinotignum urinale TaxID=190146 RepID=UPI002A80109A|nr:LssY C-terminal domain-containing protein [Actinotignum urinale]MDY5129045.1 LssY C-terminal domain-containing protein [Actinotignum urinale]
MDKRRDMHGTTGRISTRADHRWPVPAKQPVYEQRPLVKRRRFFPLYAIFSTLFIGLAMAYSLWLAGLLLVRGIPGDPWWWLHIIAFWVIGSYVAFPRLHQIFSLLYVPNYFIGRTKTVDGVLGDPVNIAWEGDAEDIHAVMHKAGWSLADPVSLSSSWKIVVSSLFRRSYPNAPVSDLYLFGRKQDFAYQIEVGGNANRRHHIRFWRCPEDWRLPGGARVTWLAAATFDRSVGLSIFTGQVTHKVDPYVDAERDFAIGTVRYGYPESQVFLLKHYFDAYHSRNGGGDEFHTDGDLPILDVSGACQALEFDMEKSVPNRLSGGQIIRDTVRGKLSATDAVKEATHHATPPISLSIIFALMCYGLVIGIVDAENSQEMWVGVLLQLGFMMILTGISLRSRFCWVVFLIVESTSTCINLIVASSSRLENLVPAGISVLIVLIVTAPKVRYWITEKKGEPRVKLAPLPM